MMRWVDWGKPFVDEQIFYVNFSYGEFCLRIACFSFSYCCSTMPNHSDACLYFLLIIRYKVILSKRSCSPKQKRDFSIKGKVYYSDEKLEQKNLLVCKQIDIIWTHQYEGVYYSEQSIINYKSIIFFSITCKDFKIPRTWGFRAIFSGF